MPDTDIKIFYSWQSDLPNSTTRGLIQSSIDAAVKGLRNTVEVEADRDTKGIYGSPDIVQTIFEKIDDCDVFIADVSGVVVYHPLNNDGEQTERLKMAPNPNVLLELGYAAQAIGWENIICVMNEDYAENGEIPFDIDHRRLMRYSLKKREKSDVRKELRDIISSTVLNVIENGKRVRPQFSNISVGSWNEREKSVSKVLIPYNLYEPGPAQTMLDTLLNTARLLLENIQSAEIRHPAEFAEDKEIIQELNDSTTEQILMTDGVKLTPLSSKGLFEFNTWESVIIPKQEKAETAEDLKKYCGIEVDDTFFDFGSLKQRRNIIPGVANEYAGTDGEQQKYNDYIELQSTIIRIQMLETYRKTFDGLILLPLAAKNESTVSDNDIHIAIKIDESTAEAIYPTSELICDDLKGIEDSVYEEGLVELTLAQNETVDIKGTKDDRFWGIEDQQSDMNAIFQGGINGLPRYSAEDYARELSRYIASPENGTTTDFSFYIESLHAKEVKWLSQTIILKPLKENVRLKYFVKSGSSDGSLEGTLELTL